jgi:transcriptional regulator with XRE-family HTH domain
MALDPEILRERLDRVFARQDTYEACLRRDLGAVIRILGKYGITQGQIASMTGFPQGQLSDYATGKHQPMAASKFMAFADGLGMPARLRRALGLAPGGSYASQAGSGLDVPTDTFDLQLLAEEVGRRGDSVKRREMLLMAAQLGASTVLAQSEVWERLAYALTNPTAMNEAIVKEMEARSAGFHRLEQYVSAQILFKGLALHLREVGTLLNGTAYDPSDDLRRRMIVVAGESSVLAGWIASDRGEHSAARSLYETAEKAAREAGDPGILACALGYRSYISSMKGVHGRSRTLLGNALEMFSHSDSPGTVAWLAARHAEESAALGDRSGALKSWAQADEAYSVADPEEDRVWTRFMDRNRFDAFRISTFAGVGKLDEAQEIAKVMISRLSESDRKKAAIILEDIAAASLARGAVSDAATLARDGLAAVRETEYAIWLPKFEGLGVGLSRWRNQPSVHAFLEDLAMTKRQFASSPS